MERVNYISDWDLYFFKMANLVAKKSKDPSSQVGSIIVKDKRIISTGFNGFCVGVKDFEERYTDRKIKYSMVAHSEFNACITASRFGISLLDSEIYTQTLPCENCAKSIIQSGIKTVKTLKICEDIWAGYATNWIESKKITQQMFNESGVEVIEYNFLCDDEILVGGKVYKI